MQANDSLAHPHLSPKCQPHTKTCPCSSHTDNQQKRPSPRALSDTEIVIGGTAMLDQHTYDLLMAVLGGNLEQRKWLLHCHARRRALSYCLGYISKEMFDDMVQIGRIRNRFAHYYPLCSFDDAKIKVKVARLSRHPGGEVSGLDGQMIFIETVYGLAEHLNEQLFLAIAG